MPRRKGRPEPELRVGCHALMRGRGKIVRVDALEGEDARVTVQGGAGPSAAQGWLVDLESLTCGRDELSALD